MTRILALAAIALAWGFAHMAVARADEAQFHRCRPVADARKLVDARNGRWAAVTPEQFQFLRGIYAMNPTTPAGLPFGASAVLATMPGAEGGTVVFIDGDLACTPMPVPQALIDLLTKVGAGDVTHEGSAM